jgi:hypothetical protein
MAFVTGRGFEILRFAQNDNQLGSEDRAMECVKSL